MLCVWSSTISFQALLPPSMRIMKLGDFLSHDFYFFIHHKPRLHCFKITVVIFQPWTEDLRKNGSLAKELRWWAETSIWSYRAWIYHWINYILTSFQFQRYDVLLRISNKFPPFTTVSCMSVMEIGDFLWHSCRWNFLKPVLHSTKIVIIIA